MFTAAALTDLHARTHRSLGGFLDHAETMPTPALRRALEGFGYPTVLLQLHHAVTAERYWVGVLQGEVLVDEHEADHASIDALRAYRNRVAADTAAYLGAADEAELDTPRPMTTWDGTVKDLVPARVILRTQTHVFQHLGQVAAMCRLLGHPAPRGLDFPLD